VKEWWDRIDEGRGDYEVPAMKVVDFLVEMKIAIDK
jgi:hypothetical protein